jgi:hypothetical protein
MGSPAATARSSSAPPEETPCAYTGASGLTAAMTAARSSISRSTANGAVSPLSPRPRRSYDTARSPWPASACARSAQVPRSLKAPPTITTVEPSPQAS